MQFCGPGRIFICIYTVPFMHHFIPTALLLSKHGSIIVITPIIHKSCHQMACILLLKE